MTGRCSVLANALPTSTRSLWCKVGFLVSSVVLLLVFLCRAQYICAYLPGQLNIVSFLQHTSILGAEAEILWADQVQNRMSLVTSLESDIVLMPQANLSLKGGTAPHKQGTLGSMREL